MLAATPTLLPRVVLETQSRWNDGRWRAYAMRLASVDGLRQTIGLEGTVGEFLEKLDGSRTLEELISELTAEAPVEPSRVRAECVGMVRLLAERGFVAL
jgi:hypothetical protein